MTALAYTWYEGPAASPVLVLLHGWGMHRAVWTPWLPYLQPHFSVLTVDLPGFGQSLAMPEQDFYATLHALLPADASVWWLGWSMGAIHAVALAKQHMAMTQALCMVAANPCFLQKEDWPHAMSAADFLQFQRALETHIPDTLKKFLALQCQGSQCMKKDWRFLQGVLNEQAWPSLAVLQNGLQALAQHDWRAELQNMAIPTLVLLGENDALVPAAWADNASHIGSHLNVHRVQGAAHLPFVSHPETCAAALVQVLEAMR